MPLDFFAGCLGGCAGVIVGHPFDTLKTHMQAPGGQHNGTLACLRHLVTKNSPRVLYRGVTSPLAGVAAINAIVFGVHANIHRRLPDTLSSHFIAGATAGFLQSFLASPVELLKTRAQINGSTPMLILKEILEKQGLKGLYRGMTATVLREAPSFGAYFWTYELLTQNDKRVGRMLFAGGVAGVASWLIVYPVDVLKTRMQLDDGAFHNLWTHTKRCVATEGLMSLSRGLGATLLRAFPVNAATFGVVTWTLSVSDNIVYGLRFGETTPA